MWTAKRKLNVAYLNGILIIALLAGCASGSLLAFLAVATVLTAGAVYAGDIRVRRRRT